MNKLDSTHWSNYWDKGTITTFHKHFGNNYDGEIKGYWEEVYSDLQNGSRVVDLATGNGALLLLLDNLISKTGKKINACGIDFAKLNPAIVNSIKSKDIIFKEETLIEKTGLCKNSIDIAISQYGVEYSNLSESIIELDRVLKNKAKINFIMHNTKSQIVIDAKSTLDQINLINKKLKITSVIKELLPAIEGFKKTGQNKYKKKADRFRNKFNKAVTVLQEYSKPLLDTGYVDFYYENALSVFSEKSSRTYSLKQKLSVLKIVEKETKNLKLRMTDLISVAMSDSMNSQMQKALISIGFKIVRIRPLIYDGFNLGQIVESERFI